MEAQNRKEYLQELAHKSKQGGLTDEEQAFFDTWYNSYKDELLELPEDYARNSNVIRDRMLKNLKQRVKADKTQHGRIIPIYWRRTAVAASILLCLGLGFYEYTAHQYKTTAPIVARTKVLDLPPGSNQATLTLAGGRKIILTNQLQGQIATQGNTAIQAKSGTIAYNATSNDQAAIAYNTLSTTRGQQSPVPLVLADGTKVWLNAASSITFPTAFNEKNREVKITGEVYFEVVHNENKPPLRIIANGQVVQDIGTKFNINAYSDEPVVKTTLLEGSVQLSAGNAVKTLKPGQQAKVKDGTIKIIPDADTEEAIAWHKGLFKFNDADIPSVMRQLARWYDVDITYEGKVSARQFSGKIYRNISALKVSDILSYNDIHFRIEGKKIIVEP
jgi:transmembrane sensor